MRILVTLLCLLAAGKVAAVEWLHRSSSDDVIIATFTPRALEACGRDARHKALGLDAAAWAPNSPVHLEIGQRHADVALWQVDNPAWGKRFRHPHLHLTATGAQVACDYDVLLGVAVARKI